MIYVPYWFCELFKHTHIQIYLNRQIIDLDKIVYFQAQVIRKQMARTMHLPKLEQ